MEEVFNDIGCYGVFNSKPIFIEALPIMKLSDTAILPTQGSAEAAGWDLYADLKNIGLDEVQIAPGQVVKISAGGAIALPQGTFGAIYARSGMATKRGLRPANCTGVIDADYRGPLLVAIRNDSNAYQTIQHGERIAQLVVQPYVPVILVETDSLPSTARGEGGFGSTGTN